MMIKKYFVILVLLCLNAGAQHKKFNIPDSLRSKGFSYYSQKLAEKPADTAKALLYARCWVEKSKIEANYKELASAYKAMLYNAGRKHQSKYADSILLAAGRTRDDLVIGSAYLTKGSIHYERKQLKEALNNYLRADSFISKTNDAYMMHKVKYVIGLTKSYLGFYEEAISLLKECVEYFSEENDRAYLNSLHALAVCYNHTGKYALSAQTNRIGLTAGRELEDLSMEPYFILSEGVNQASLRNYNDAIAKLTSALPGIERNKDFANVAIANFYLAKCYWSMGKKDLALPFLKKVDAVFLNENYIRPDLRETYEMLIEYYIGRNDKDGQLVYINRLLKADSVINNDYKYLSAKVIKQFDTAKLLRAKAKIENNRKLVYFAIIGSLLLTVLYLAYRHHANKKYYRQKYEELMNRKPGSKTISSNAIKDSDPDIRPEVVETILKNLETFEARKKFLEKDMNLVRLADLLDTNTKYVTKIIQRYRGKGTIEYVSDLKIEHVIELLKTENRYRNYTNKALGDEIGFGTTQNFTRAFKANTGMSPTYFIAELRKSMDT